MPENLEWKYYNHAMIPTCPPHETPNLAPILDNSIWKTEEGTPLLARWTSNFDCERDTGWYYVIKEAPFQMEELDAKCRKHIRQALKKVCVKKVDPKQFAQELFEVYDLTTDTYDNYVKNVKLEDFYNEEDESIDYWAGFTVDTDKMIGYMKCKREGSYVQMQVSKYLPKYLNYRVSDALHYHTLQYYLNEKRYSYVCSGSKSISHRTNAQEYKMKNFQFRKVFCELNIQYNPKYKVVVMLLYRMRKIWKKFDNIGIVHKVNGVLQMEEIVRIQKKILEESAGE